ncbi:MAG TPA: KUP/HAK/KT family potassium transporter, partial [Ramlibacter sp.]
MTTTAMTVCRESQAALTLGALGVVYGDIGTSPLYTMKEVFNPAHRLALDTANLVGAVSLIVWGLIFVVTLKYVLLILRADNNGEGGIMALTALAAKAAGRTPGRRLALLLVGVFGAALFYGDSIITPAISVLSAVEGLEVATPALKPFVLPLSLAVLVGLFAMQRFGTGLVGTLFGPVIGAWFVVLAVVGVVQIAREPAILSALDPLNGLRFALRHGWRIFVILGAVVLAFTGAEALYADMGHFGKRPIRIAWTGLVLPSLALNYMGQGALLMREPAALEQPFYHLFSSAMLLPAVVLATAATIIASQAVITGAYSLTQQAIQLGLLPRMQTMYTSEKEIGQIYIPVVNWMLLVAVVLAFTGAEALYADMGHFGKRPIRVAWFAVAMPALLLNYFGQGAMLLEQPETARNP